MSMDRIFPGNGLRYRAITNPQLHHLAYWVIILGEALSGVLCSIGALRLFRCLHSDTATFHSAKSVAALRLALPFTVWFLRFIGIGGGWVALWPAAPWDGQSGATRLPSCTGVSLPG